jgi:hypothetical protein
MLRLYRQHFVSEQVLVFWVLSRSGAKHRIASQVKAWEGGNNLVSQQPL